MLSHCDYCHNWWPCDKSSVLHVMIARIKAKRNLYVDLWNMKKKNMDDKFIAEVSKNDSNLMKAYILTYLNQYNPFVRRCFYVSSSLLWLLGAHSLL
jgi:hypothetical protein